MTLMNPDLTPLKTYIRSQRANNKTDEVITASLTAAGWQADMVTLAFGEMQHEHETQVTQPAIATEKPSMNQDESARAVVEPQEQLATVESVDSPQQSAIQTDESDKYCEDYHRTGCSCNDCRIVSRVRWITILFWRRAGGNRFRPACF